MGLKSDSNTGVGSRAGGKPLASRSGTSGALRPRGARPAGAGSKKKSSPQYAQQQQSLWSYSDDSAGFQVGPVPVLVLSMLFIASVFILHIWGKFSRG